MRRSAAAAIAVLCAGCQTYTPIDLASAPPRNSSVRLTLSDIGAIHLAALVGPHAADIEGRITSINDSSVVLAVSGVTRTSGVDENWSGEPVTVPRADIARADQQKTSVARSVLITAILVGGAAIATKAASGGTAEGGSPVPSGAPGGH